MITGIQQCEHAWEILRQSEYYQLNDGRRGYYWGKRWCSKCGAMQPYRHQRFTTEIECGEIRVPATPTDTRKMALEQTK